MPHPHVAAFFAEHESPAHASRTATHDALTPIHQLVASVRKQIIEYQTRIDSIERNEPPKSIIGELERLHQTLGAMERHAQALMMSGRELARAVMQFDTYMTEIKATVAKDDSA